MKTFFDIKKLGFNSTDYNMLGMTCHFLNGRYRGFNLQSIIDFPRGMNEKRILLLCFLRELHLCKPQNQGRAG